jgi:predicted ATP-grasp superfamily ATP-dependent carboligase
MKNNKKNTVIDHYSYPMIQEYIPGDIHDVCALFDHGVPVAALSQKRLLVCPPTGGPGFLNETTYEPQLISKAVKLLRKLKWHGVAQVEFKYDSQGTPRLMEINPKFWGTLDLSIAAGIDFPFKLFQLSMEGVVKKQFNYKIGLQHAWPVASFDCLHANIRKKELKEIFSRKMIALHCRKYDFSINDPTPDIIFLTHKLVNLLRKYTIM